MKAKHFWGLLTLTLIYWGGFANGKGYVALSFGMMFIAGLTSSQYVNAIKEEA